MMKNQPQNPCLALWLSAVEATQWCQLGFQYEDDSQEHMECGAEQILQIDYAADCAGSLDLSCMKCDKRVSVTEHLHKLDPYSLHSMIEVSSKAWHAIPYLVTVMPWQHPQRLGMLFYILSCLGSTSRGLACLLCLGSICHGLACYSISYHSLAVSTEAWHAVLYLIMP